MATGAFKMTDVLAGMIIIYLSLFVLFPKHFGKASREWLKDFKKGYDE